MISEDPAAIAKMIRCANCGGFGQGLVKEHGFCNAPQRVADEKEKVDKKTSWRAETGVGFVMYYNSDR